jgi:hypothetical protein
MLLRRTVSKVLPLALFMAACADGGPLPSEEPRVTTPAASAPDTGPLAVEPAEPACATPRVETWTGTAIRSAETYPDDIAAEVTWRRVSSSGCVDRYAPSGGARYTFAIPGAICRQDVAPAQSAVAGAHGTLTVDRSTSPATYRGEGATTWSVTWTCTQQDGTVETMTFDGGGLWFEAEGTLEAAAIAGTRVEEDGVQCGLGQSSLPCTYTWSFDPTE